MNGRIKITVGKAEAKSRQTRRWRRNVFLGKEVVEVCPYCLEEVKANDPRGRVVCRICRTAHHADCWAIAGRCQIALLGLPGLLNRLKMAGDVSTLRCKGRVKLTGDVPAAQRAGQQSRKPNIRIKEKSG